MSAQLSDPPPPLGIGDIVQESFRLLVARIGPILAIGFVISALSLLLTWILLGPEAIVGTAQIPSEDEFGTAVPAIPTFGFGAALLSFLFQTLAYGLTIAALVLLALDAKTGRGRPARDYLIGAVPFILPVVVLSIAVGLLAGVGMLALILPGLWLYAVFSVFIPVIVLEGTGYGALGRSAELTAEYRWPIVGLVIVLVAILIAVTLVIGVVVGLPLALIGPSIGEDPSTLFVFVTVLINAAGGAIGNGFGAIVATLLYARLRELKEGVRLPDLTGSR